MNFEYFQPNTIDIDIYHRRRKKMIKEFSTTKKKKKRFALLRMINKDIILIMQLNWIGFLLIGYMIDQNPKKNENDSFFRWSSSSSFILLTFFVHSFNQMFIFFFIIYFNSIEWMNVFSRWLVVWERQEIYFTFEWMKSKRKRSKFIIII